MNEKIKLGFNRFIYESFRKRRKEDYLYLFSKFKKEKNEIPWFYLRVALGGFFAFTFLFLMNTLFSFYNDGYVLAIGCCFLDLTFLTLCYEMIRKKEISFLRVLWYAFLSSIFVILFCLIMQSLIDVKSSYLDALKTGILEEFAKGIFAIVIVLTYNAFHKKTEIPLAPVTALIIGAAVGAGFAINENFDYIFLYYHSEADTLYLVFERGLSGLACHMAWTAFITYAFVKIKKPLCNIKFYFVLIASIAIHTFWDFSEFPGLSDETFNTIQSIICILYCIFASILMICIIHKENSFKESKLLPKVYTMEMFRLSNIDKMWMTCIISYILIALCGFQLVYYKDGGNINNNELYHYEVDHYDYVMEYDDFIRYVQDGKTFDIDYNRAYDSSVVDQLAIYQKGELVRATQVVKKEDVNFIYYYAKSEGELKLSDISIEVEEQYYSESYLVNVDDSSDSHYTYYNIIELEHNDYVIYKGAIYNEIFVKVYSTQAIIIGIVMMAIVLANLGIVFVLIGKEKKAREEFNRKQIINI